MGKTHRSAGVLLAVFSGAMYGTMATFTRFLYDFGLSDTTIAVLPPLFLFIFFFAVQMFRNPGAFFIPRKMLFLLAVDGILVINGINLSFANEVAYFPVSVMTVVNYCYIFVIMFLSAFILKEKIRRYKIIACCVVVLGVSMVLNIWTSSRLDDLRWQGLMWLAVAWLTLAGNIVMNKYFLDHGVDGFVIMAYINAFAVISLCLSANPLIMFSEISAGVEQYGPGVWGAILGYGLVPNILCYLTFIIALNKISATILGVAYSFDPLTSALLGVLIFGDRLGLIQITGIVIILATVTWVQLEEGKEDSQNQPSAPAE